MTCPQTSRDATTTCLTWNTSNARGQATYTRSKATYTRSKTSHAGCQATCSCWKRERKVGV